MARLRILERQRTRGAGVVPVAAPPRQRADRQRRRRQDGFTLVEVLVGATIGLVVAGLAALALHGALAVWARAATANVEALEAERLLAWLARDMASAALLEEPAFAGGPDGCTLRRLRPGPTPTAPATPVRVVWSVPSGAGRVLREEHDWADDDDDAAAAVRRESFAPVPAFRLRYAPPANGAGIPAWEESWDPLVRSGLPVAVRVSLQATERVLECMQHAPAQLRVGAQ